MSHTMGECPICKKLLLPGSDIVTCPECGTPYHRTCYEREGQCTFADKHGTGYEYQPPQKDFEPESTSSITCQRCGKLNAPNTIFCIQCGAPLHTASASSASQGQASGGFGTFVPPITVQGEIDGIKSSDWAMFFGKSSSSYMLRLQQQVTRKSKISIMFSAFLLGPYYFAYRKMWGLGTVLLIFSILTSIPVLFPMMLEMNSPLIAGLATETMDILMQISSFASLFVQILCGLFAMFLYRKHSEKKIKKLRVAFDQDTEYHTALVRKGGVSVIGVAVFLIITSAASTVLALLM